jgi:hypothetical protein
LRDYRFGSLLKPAGKPVAVGARYQAFITVAAVRCYGSEDPSGSDEPYLVSNCYAVDPFRKDDAVTTRRNDFPDDISPPMQFGQGTRIAEEVSIPGDGHIKLDLALYDRELGASDHLEKKWSDITKTAILAGLSAISPLVGATAAVLEDKWALVTGVADLVGSAVADIFGDDLIAIRTLVIKPEYLERLILDPPSLTLTSGSIPGTAYNFPETSESGPEGGSWLFSGGGGTYRIFFNIQATRQVLTPLP